MGKIPAAALFVLFLAFGFTNCGIKDSPLPPPTTQPQPLPPQPPERTPWPQLVPQAAANAIAWGCSDPLGYKALDLSYEECVLVLLGASYNESSWDVNKECQVWGAPEDPTCGLTQSRRSDAVAVGLTCDPTLKTPEGYRCNALTGLRNLRCQADNGYSCDLIGPGRSLYIGVVKHLGQNKKALPNYLTEMERIYNNVAIRYALKISDNIEPWSVLLFRNR